VYRRLAQGFVVGMAQFFKSRKRLNQACLFLPNDSTSVQVSAPAMMAQRAMVMMLMSGWSFK